MQRKYSISYIEVKYKQPSSSCAKLKQQNLPRVLLQSAKLGKFLAVY